jgi:hypothetical protein
MTRLPAYLEQQALLYRLNKAREASIWSVLSGLPKPYDLQRDILLSPAKRKVIAAGRQVGKTMTASMSAIGGAEYGGCGLLDGAHVHISSTSQDQSDLFWDYITTWLADVINMPGFYKNEGRRILKYRGGQIRVKTGRNPDALRGGNVDKLILDECAFLDPDAWRKAGQPMLLARNGVAEFYSSPRRRNWFFELYNYAVDPTNTSWRGWNFPTTANPHLSREALDLLTSDMTQEDYRQEILAEFLEGQGAVFRYVNERCTVDRRDPYPGRFVGGLDWGKDRDSTCLIIIDAETRTVVDFDRFTGIDWSLQRGRVRVMYERWKPHVIVGESNSIGGPNVEALQADGLPIMPFETTGVSKPPLIESLVLAFDRGEITVINDPVIKGELMAYERRISHTGRSQYSAPEGMHDDTVIALALAWHGVTQFIPLRVTQNIFYD